MYECFPKITPIAVQFSSLEDPEDDEAAPSTDPFDAAPASSAATLPASSPHPFTAVPNSSAAVTGTSSYRAAAASTDPSTAHREDTRDMIYAKSFAELRAAVRRRLPQLHPSAVTTALFCLASRLKRGQLDPKHRMELDELVFLVMHSAREQVAR